MTIDINDRLHGRFDQYQLGEQLHDVPPHIVYELDIGARQAVYKQDTGPTGNAGVEGRVMAYVAAETSIPVPEVVAVGEDWVVTAWHPDAPDDSHEVTEPWASVAGKGLATLHEQTEPGIDEYGHFTVRDGSLTVDGASTWQEAVLDYLERYQSTLLEHEHGDIGNQVIEYVDTHPEAFENAGTPVCCHGWATPEHVTVRDGELACVIDFEHAIAAPAEFDYWRTCLPTFTADATALQDRFRRAYESVREFPPGLRDRQPLYALLHSIYFFESLYVQDQHGPDATAERAEWLRNRITTILDELD